MLERVPFTDTLDVFLQEVVRAMHAAVTLGIRSIDSDPAVSDKVLEDCTQTLAVIMAGHVQEWINP